MKCTSCGNTNLVKTYFPLDGETDLSNKVEVYLCLECGHYEFFSMEKVADYKQTSSKISEMEREIVSLRLELERLQDPATTKKINDEIRTVKTQLSSLDITIRQQQELKMKLSELNGKLTAIPNKIRITKDRLDHLISDLRTIKYNFGRGNF